MKTEIEDLVRLDRDGGIVILTLNNPNRRNAFSLNMREAFYQRLLALEHDASCRAIVLTGAAGQFCSGGDVTEMQRRTVLESRLRLDLPTRIFKLLVTGPKPFVAAVEGSAVGAGLSLVAASDYAVAAADAVFSCAFIKMAALPDVGGLWSIPRRVGRRRAMELCGLGETIGAEAALEMGLLNAVCPPGEALTQALEVARRLGRNPPLAMALLRSALSIGSDTLDQAINTEINLQGVLFASEDFDEAATAFREKRRPVFKGK